MLPFEVVSAWCRALMQYCIVLLGLRLKTCWPDPSHSRKYCDLIAGTEGSNAGSCLNQGKGEGFAFTFPF